MPVYGLGEELIFPHPVLREPDGFMAVGGDLTPERLLLAYRWGIFPWYQEGQPLLWWWLAPRLVMHPGDVHISHSLKKVLDKKIYSVTIDTCFQEVMLRCATISRKGQQGTWITDDMMEAYIRLHRLGLAHSVEVFDDSSLIGGIYGVALGKIFFGESMFATKSNASKVAFVHLASYLREKEFEWIDCQQDTQHMRSLGAYLVEEDEFLSMLRRNHLFILQHGNNCFGSATKMPD